MARATYSPQIEMLSQTFLPLLFSRFELAASGSERAREELEPGRLTQLRRRLLATARRHCDDDFDYYFDNERCGWEKLKQRGRDEDVLNFTRVAAVGPGIPFAGGLIGS